MPTGTTWNFRPGTGAKATGKTVLLYGHLDKQPEMTGWRDDSGPWTPLLEDGKLYGRGSADDGYAVFAALAAVLALDAENISRPRCIGLIETCEESGSYDLPPYLDALAARGIPVRRAGDAVAPGATLGQAALKLGHSSSLARLPNSGTECARPHHRAVKKAPKNITSEKMNQVMLQR